MNKEHTRELSSNAFGKLVKSFREQRNWSQGQLAQKWGHTREYVSLIERGERKLDKQAHVYHLADILGIPTECLDAVGKGVPPHRTHAEKPTEADAILLQALLEPALATTKLSWLLWLANSQHIPVAEHLANLTVQIEDASRTCRGPLLKPALRVLAYAQDVQGKMAFDELRFTEANGHLQEVLDLGQELKDRTLMALAQMQRADVLQERGRYETAVRMLDAVRPTVEQAEDFIKGPYYQICARVYAQYGYEYLFLEYIDKSEDRARNIKESIDTQYHQFTLREVLQERAQGFIMLSQPEKALAIFAQMDQLQPLYPIRARGWDVILKAQAHTYNGDMDTGIDLALEGIKLARSYGSRRHVSRIQQMYDRLEGTALGKHPRMKDLKHVLG